MPKPVEQASYSIKEAAVILGCSPWTVRRRMDEGVLKGIDINPKSLRPTWRITRESVEKLRNGK